MELDFSMYTALAEALEEVLVTTPTSTDEELAECATAVFALQGWLAQTTAALNAAEMGIRDEQHYRIANPIAPLKNGDRLWLSDDVDGVVMGIDMEQRKVFVMTPVKNAADPVHEIELDQAILRRRQYLRSK